MDAKALHKRVEQLNGEMVQLREENEQLRKENEQLKEENERFKQENGRLREKVDKLQRANKRTTTPFRRRSSQKKNEDDKSKAPGRKPGHQGGYKEPPAKEDIDQTVRVPLDRCPGCDGQLEGREEVEQFVIELPETGPQITRLVTQKAVCDSCGCVSSTHPLQTFRATGAAAVQFGPRAKAVAVDLHKKRGLSLNKTTELFDELEGDQARAELDELRFEMASLLLDEKDNPVDEKAAARLRKRFGELFTFVGRPEVDATNNQAERELRPAVITRKISGGNKTERGARSWQILKSIECTLDRQERDFIPYLEQTLCLSMPPPTIRPS